MKAVRRRVDGPSALDLVEDAVHLVRTAPAVVLLTYYAGAVPFVLGLLYFHADMGSNPAARSHISEASLGLGLVFIWMKYWQAEFACRIRCLASFSPPPAWTFRRTWRTMAQQAILQPCSLFLAPAFLIPLPPFTWVSAFFASATALCDGQARTLRAHMAKSWTQAALWPRQNIAVSAMLIAFSTVIFLNWVVVFGVAPHLIKMLTGVDSAFAGIGAGIFNSTLFASVLGLTYLCVGPLWTAVYSLRCYHGESLHSGEDLKAEIKRIATASRAVAAAVLVGLFILVPMLTVVGEGAAGSAPSAAFPPAVQAVSENKLDQALAETIHHRKYLWRMPKDPATAVEEEDGAFVKFFSRAADMIREWGRDLADWLSDLWDRMFTKPASRESKAGLPGGWFGPERVLLYLLVVAAAALVLFLLYRLKLAKRVEVRKAEPLTVVAAIDLTDENVGADRLPEDGWTKLARELLERGDLRLAMRAFYFASLAHLASRNLLALARFKSNSDYAAELRRRAHTFPGLLPLFQENLMAFERVWYGTHEPDLDSALQFAESVEKIKAEG